MSKKILIVDDSPIARKMLKSCIPKDQGYEFHEACDGKDGYEKYQELKPDLTFMDLTMPVMTGYESIDAIVKHDNNALIIVVTADVQMTAIKRVMESGAFMVLKKPLKKEEIATAMSKAFESRSG
ncbi:MAG: histidine kinase [Nitrospira bacterium SG8_35_1]|nr:MAG: histidine kinase [Nitrospira bacterium SG8_35_1]UCH45541.1 MAG: response regulator [Nitrospiraceae bacterium]